MGTSDQIVTIPTIVTRRLILRVFGEEDIDRLHRILADKDVLRYFPNPNPPTVDGVREMITARINHWREHGYGWWAIQLHSSSDLIGWSGLLFLPDTQEVEIGYLLGKAYWGQGFATEAAEAGLRYGFEQVGLTGIVAIVHPENIASQRVIEKLGMSFVDRSRYFGMDCYRYSMQSLAFARTRGAQTYDASAEPGAP